jgi:hypothetical protein
MKKFNNKNIKMITSHLNIFKGTMNYTSASKISKSEVVGLGPNSKLLKQYKESLGKLSNIQWEAAIGLMLGDASLQTQNNGKTYRMKFEWGDKNKAYLDHVYGLFDE